MKIAMAKVDRKMIGLSFNNRYPRFYAHFFTTRSQFWETFFYENRRKKKKKKERKRTDVKRSIYFYSIAYSVRRIRERMVQSSE